MKLQLRPLVAPEATEIAGLDLTNAPSLASQLDRLDQARGGDVDEYAAAWLDVSDENGECPWLNWHIDDSADAVGSISRGIACDAQERQRRLRFDAMDDHCFGVEGFRAALRSELRRRGRFIDNRRASAIEVKAVVRAFIATGGKLLIAPQTSRRSGELIEVHPDDKRYARRSWSELDEVAAMATVRIARRWRARPLLTRIIRKLGTAENGWFVLKRGRS